MFNDKKKRKAVENILHPLVINGYNDKKLELEKTHSYLIAEIPLLFEVKIPIDFDYIILVACEEKYQIERLKIRSDINKVLAKKIIDTQIPLLDKIEKSDYVIWNNTETNRTTNKTDAKILYNQCKLIISSINNK